MDILDRLIGREGGYVNDPNDSGGETKYGISKRSYPNEDIAALTKDRAKEIYFKDYVLKHGIQFLPESVAEVVLDWTVHAGPIAVKEFQRLVGAPTVDGVIGPQTMAKLAGWDHQRLVNLLTVQRIAFYGRQVRNNPKNAKYIVGWLTRALSFMEI